jgi:hypothetical protein
MRQIGNIPRIIKINGVDGLNISVVFNNGESRAIDFKAVFDRFKIKAGSPVNKLRKPSEFRKVGLANNTLSWSNVEQYVNFNDRQVKVPFEIGADVLYKMSSPIETKTPKISVGHIIRSARERSGLTQDIVALRSGTTRNYISRIENNQSGIELDTLYKIVEHGLGQQLDIRILSPNASHTILKETHSPATGKKVRKG